MTSERKAKNMPKQKPAIDHDLIRELARLLDETGLAAAAAAPELPESLARWMLERAA